MPVFSLSLTACVVDRYSAGLGLGCVEYASRAVASAALDQMRDKAQTVAGHPVALALATDASVDLASLPVVFQAAPLNTKNNAGSTNSNRNKPRGDSNSNSDMAKRGKKREREQGGEGRKPGEGEVGEVGKVGGAAKRQRKIEPVLEIGNDGVTEEAARKHVKFDDSD